MRRAFCWAAAVLCALPALLFAGSLLIEHGAAFWDGTVYRCAIETMLSTGNPYHFAGECAEQGLPHTYPHAGTRLLAALAAQTGVGPLSVLYVALYLLGFAALLLALRRHGASPPATAAALIVPAAGIFVSELASGNMALPFFGLLFLALSRDANQTAWTVLLCLLIAPFKPLYTAYLLVPFLVRRAELAPAAGLAAIMLWYAGDAALFPPLFAEWLHAALRHSDHVPGFGFAFLLRAGGLDGHGWLPLGLAYLAWCAVVAGLTLRALRRVEAPAVRALIAVAAVALLLPRLKEYDCLVLVPLSFALWPELSERGRRQLAIIVGGLAVALPAAFWWGRKLMFLASDSGLSWRSLVDMRWLVRHQGYFLAASLAGLLLWLAFRPSDTTRQGR